MPRKWNFLVKPWGVSVIVPVYNSEDTIIECIDSIRNQTYQNLQIICVNDGSVDSSLKKLNALAEIDPRIVVIDQKNSGVSAARNAGIEAADFDYVTFVDSDDTIDSRMYEKMMKQAKLHSADCIICGSKEFKYTGEVIEYRVPYANALLKGREDIIEKLIKPIFGFSENKIPAYVSASVGNKMFFKSIITENAIKFNQLRSFGEDWQFCLEFFSCADSIFLLDETPYNYIHRGTESLVSRTRLNFLEICFVDRKNFRKLFPELDWNSPETIEDYINCPIKAAHYYRVRLKGAALSEKLDDIYSICKNDELFCKYIKERGGIYKDSFNSPSEFRSYIVSETNTEVFKSKVILFLIKIKRTFKLATRKHK